MTRAIHSVIMILLVSSVIPACKTKSKTSLEQKFVFTVEQAPEWSAMFKRNHGWFGGDGLYTLTPDGNEQQGAANKQDVIMWFSDSMLGDIINDSLQNGDTMINNTVAILRGGKPDSSAITFSWKTAASNRPASVFTPESPASQQGEYYWLGDGFVNTGLNNDMYIFGYRMKNIPGVAVFGFKQTGNTLIKIPAGERPPFTRTSQLDIPFLKDKDIDSSGSFGSAVLVNTKKAGAIHADGYLYVYGVRGKNKEVIVCRVKPEDIEHFDRWEFWNGENWTSDVSLLQPIADRASNELSVTALPDGRYVMIFQKDAIGTNIGLRVGVSPVGPFGPIQDVFDTKDDLEDSKNLIPYNAKAHPVLSQPGELLISYHINSFDFANDIRKFPHLYSPRFIKLKYKLQEN